jgi:DNA polymerase III delta prime subunit
MSRKNILWVEKYRPQNINEYIFHDELLKKKIISIINSNDLPHILLSGVQGSGKTTLSNIILNELNVNKNDILRINASDETGVDSMRDKIKSFAQTYAHGKFKVVQLEECDYLTHNAQATLRTMMEDYSENCRFIGTCNYENKIIPALKSRMQHFHFKNPNIDDILIKMGEILSNENIYFDIDVLSTYVSIAYPDIRKIINLLQQNSIDGKLQFPNNNESEIDYKFKLLDLIVKKDIRSARKLVASSVSRDEYEDFYRFLYMNVDKLTKNVDKQESIIVIISNYLYKHSIVADPEINAAACLIEISMVI